MKLLILVGVWALLFFFCWPLALLALLLVPVIWLVSLPFRLLAICIEATFALMRGILLLPARLFGVKPAPR